MKIITYNVNGIRSAIRKGFMQWLEDVSPDVLCIQETKAQPSQVPLLEFEKLGYQGYLFSAEKKGYSGVAIFTKKKPDNVTSGMNIPRYDREGRFIRADYGDLSIVSVYHPAGISGETRQAFKMEWLEDFLGYIHKLKQTRKKLIICGDFNISHQEIDIHDPVRNANRTGFLPEEREWVTKFLNSGFIDTFRYFVKEPHHYTWWSFRANARARNLGWRLDYNMASDVLEDALVGVKNMPEAKHSDHCPVMLEIKN